MAVTFLPRALSHALLKAVETFPAVVLTGPRQSGKTTLLKTSFPATHAFVSLEEPDVRLRAKEDPRAFLSRHQPPVILDEIQYVPELLSYVKTEIDRDRKPGQWLVTGSQNFALMQGVSQSLAGRAAVLSLLPFSWCEKLGNGSNGKDVEDWLSNPEGATPDGEARLEDWLLRGAFPEIASNPRVDRQLWCGSYITTYLERDVRNLASVGDLGQFERFLRLCAARTAQILNLSEMARDIGISVPTAKRWLSILETGYQIYLLYPYYRNLSKRIVKSPKLYFTDTGLATYLLGLNDAEALLNGPSFGAIFETMVVCDFLKRFLHQGLKPSLYYLRSRDGLEVDLVIETGGKLHLLEIKTAMTVTSKHATSLARLRAALGSQAGAMAVISRSRESHALAGTIRNIPWRALAF